MVLIVFVWMSNIEHLPLHLTHISQFIHQLWKHIFICFSTSFHNYIFFSLLLECCLQFVYPCCYNKHLKRKAPSFWFIIIMLENIIWFSSYTSPFIYWLKNPLNIWKILSKLFNKSWFACSNISFDREIWFHIFNIDNYDI